MFPPPTKGTEMKNLFVSQFAPKVGDSRDEMVKKFEEMLSHLKRMAKEGYEHDPSACGGATTLHGDIRGGWISPETNKCSGCGLWVKDLKAEVAQVEYSLQRIREFPKSFRWGPKGDGSAEPVH